MSQLNNGKGLLSPPAQHSPEEAKDGKLEAKLEEEKHQEEVKANIAGFRSMQEFHQKLMNGVNNGGEKRREEEEAALGMKQEPEPVEEEPIESFDVNRNKSETERREDSSPRVEKETALDLSTPRKSPAGSETMASSGDESSPCSPPHVEQHQPQQVEPASPPRTESPIASSKEEEKEPRGFQPVNAASKSFIPVTENISLFPKTSPTVPTSSPFARTPFSAGGTTDPSLPFPCQSFN